MTVYKGWLHDFLAPHVVVWVMDQIKMEACGWVLVASPSPAMAAALVMRAPQAINVILGVTDVAENEPRSKWHIDALERLLKDYDTIGWPDWNQTHVTQTRDKFQFQADVGLAAMTSTAASSSTSRWIRVSPRLRTWRMLAPGWVRRIC